MISAINLLRSKRGFDEIVQAFLAVAQAIAGLIMANAARVTVRAVASTNINLAAWNGVNNGVNFAAGDLIALVRQTAPAENGIYVVGTPVAGVYPLTRAAGFEAGATILPGTVIEVGNAGPGTLYGNSTWKNFGSGVYGTDDPDFYPKTVFVTIVLAAGTFQMGESAGLWLRDASTVALARNTVGGNTALTVEYAAPDAQRTTGKAGVALLSVNAALADGTLNNADTSTIDVTINNW